MIGYLHGTALAPDTVCVGGVGYEVTTTAPLTVGESVTLWVHMTVAETDQSLYGFATAAERDLFRALLKVRGVGARKAMGLWTLGVAELARALRAGDAAALGKASGFSAKSGQAILDTIALPAHVLAELAPDTAPAPVAAPAALVAALSGMGYTETAARAALEQASASGVTDEAALLGAALSMLSRGAVA